MGVSDGPRWKVFVSHTSELRDYPEGRSYIAAVEEAVTAAGHVVVDMKYFGSRDEAPASVCIKTVRECDIYVGVLGTRYGSPVRDRPEVSYTELEFDTATEAKITRLVFRLDTRAADLGIPPVALIDMEYGARQTMFVERVKNEGLMAQSFTSPENLARLVERSLQEEETQHRIDAGMTREKQPAEPQPAAVSKFVNPPPMTAPLYFADRHMETGLLGGCLADPAMRLVTVVGRGGIGKTAMVCRLLKGLEAGEVPDQPEERTHMEVDGIVYLSKNGLHPVAFDSLLSDLGRLLPGEVATRVEGLPKSAPPDRLMLALLEGFPTGLVVVMLDNLESALDAHTGALVDQALHDALVALLEAPEHGVKVIVTTQILPSGLGEIAGAAQQILRLDEGLPLRDAKAVLRRLDRDGTLGLKNASDEELGLAWERTRGFPRALEALKAILASDRTTSLSDVLDQISDLSAANVVRELVGKAFDGLDREAQQVMQAVAVHPGPVSVVGVDYLLQPYNPTVDAAPILARLVGRELVRYNSKQYSLHPIDRDYALSRILTVASDDLSGEPTLAALRERAAKYYAEIRTPRESWRSLDDIQPQLAEFELRCATGDWDTAAEVLADIDFDYLARWGYYRLLVDLRTRLNGNLNNSELQFGHVNSLGLSYYSLGDYETAIERHTEALTLALDIADRGSEAIALTNLGNSNFRLGDYQTAIDQHTEALTINRAIGYREGEAHDLGNLGLCYADLGDYPTAIDRHTEALTINRDIGSRVSEANQLGNLGGCYAELGDYPTAIDRHTEALTIDRAIGYREGEAGDLGNLGGCYADLGDYPTAIDRHTEALTIARSIGASDIADLVLCGLGGIRLAMGDTADARSLFDEALAISDETGMAQSSVMGRLGLARLLVESADMANALTVVDGAMGFTYPLAQPKLLLLRGVALLGIGRGTEATRAFEAAVTSCDDLIFKAPNNVAALDARWLASCGVSVSEDSTQVATAFDSFSRARAVTTAAGLVADAVRLFDVIASYDRHGLLAGLRDAMGRR